MDTQTDSQAGMQMHSIVAQHHQQQQHTSDNSGEGSSADTPCDKIASSSGSSSQDLGSSSIIHARQSESSMNATNLVESSSELSCPVTQAEAPLSSPTATSMSRNSHTSQSPLSLQQFTHHPLQHYQHHLHHHSDTILHENVTNPDLSLSRTSPPLIVTMGEALTSPRTESQDPSGRSIPSPDPYISTKTVPQAHSESHRRLSQSPSLPTMTLHLPSDPFTQTSAFQSFALPSGAEEHDTCEEASSSDVEPSPCSMPANVDSRNPRTSIGSLTDISLQSYSPRKIEAIDSHSNGIMLNRDALPYSTQSFQHHSVASSSVQDTALGKHHATAKAKGARITRRHLIAMAPPGASETRAVANTARSVVALSSSPSIASYSITSTSSRPDQSTGQNMHGPSTTATRPFISPNALLHRRLIASPHKANEKRRRLSPDMDTTSPGPLQEYRRSSLGNDLSPSSSTSAQGDAVPPSACATFQLQPVPLGKRKKTRRSSLAGQRTTDVASPRMEKRLRMCPPAGQPSVASSRQYRGLLTSVVKPADSLQRSIHKAHLIGQEASLDLRVQVKKPQTALAGLNTPSQPRSRFPRPRLSRTQSLPNLKAIPEMDMSRAVTHHLALPTRLVDYLSSLRERVHIQHQQQPVQSATTNGVASTPLLHRDRMTGSSMAAQASSFARNGYCSTTVDPLGNIKSTFIPSLHPPITRQTLKELDLHEILKNPQLRHDIVFDANVQFRPNFDGERGRKKKEFGNKYWYAIQKEIETGCTCTSFNGKMLLPCACGMDNGKTITGRYTGSLSSIKSPMPSLANYAHTNSGFTGFAAGRQECGVPMTPAQASAKMKSPRSAIGLGSGRIPSRIPLLIQELRAICLSVLPSPSSVGEPLTPATASAPSNGRAYAPSSARITARTPLTASSSVATHHIMIAQALDPLLITQQLQHGLLDIAGLMSFLGSILKLHCAPMRDDIIETMIKTVCVDGEVGMGLRMCFEILELMKLDTANHQLRSSRMYLIETAVDFEIRWFREQLDQRKITLERTRQWFSTASEEERTSQASSSNHPSTRTKAISKSFDVGLLRLIMDPVLDSASSPATNTLSAASLKHACTNNYPETFQFDAYRLMSFHGDVTDITIVHMLLLLFRQLSCSSSNLAQATLPDTTMSAPAIQENASSIATRQLNSVKNEIWTLLHDADQEISSINVPKTPATPASTPGRLLSQSALSGSNKLDNPTWRKAMNDVVLQIAARAIEVQIQARRDSRAKTTFSPICVSPPREETMKMLMSWVETNLRKESPLHKLCQQRLKNVLLALLDEDQRKDRPATTTRKDRDEGSTIDEESPSKRIRLEGGVPLAVSHHEDNQSDVALAIKKGGLEPFVAEIKLLSERIIKVRNFHLRVFRSLYEKIAAETHIEVQ